MNTATTAAKTVEQLKLELQQAEEALREQERLVRERERQEKWAAEKAAAEAKQVEINKRMLSVLQPIFHALAATGIKCQIKTRGSLNLPYIATLSTDTDVLIGEEFIKSGYRSQSPSGRFLITLGDRYRDFPAVRYPQKKDGTFNVEKIVKTIQERIDIVASRKAQAVKAAEAKAKAASLAERLCEELGTDRITGVSEYGGYDHRGRWEKKSYAATAGHVYVKVGTPMLNEAQTRVLVKALAEVAKLATKKEAS